MSRSEERERLLRNLERSRRRLDRRLSGVSRSLDVSERVGRSIRDNTGLWIGGGVLAGIVLSVATSKGKERAATNPSGSPGSAPSSFDVSRWFAPVVRQIAPLFLPALQTLLLRGIEQWLREDGRSRAPRESQR